MEIIDFLNGLRSELPLHQGKDKKSFLTFLENYFIDVVQRLEELDSEQLWEIAKTFNWNCEQIRQNFEYLTRKIIRTSELFYDGKHASAYYHLKKNVLNIDLDKSGHRYIDFLNTNGFYNPDFFRIRIKEDKTLSSANDLFHIPFHSRTEIKPQRFSLMGHPSLYLSTSIFTCWKEMGQPDINKFFVSKFNTTCPLLFTDLSIPSKFFDLSIKDNAQSAFRFLITFPLIAASTVKVKKPESPFKPEYVIPQLLLQFIRGEKLIDGIMYTSTKVLDKDNIDAWDYRNVVNPVKSNKEFGYCEKLRKKFIISAPMLIDEKETNIPMMNFFRSVERKLFSD